MNSQINKQEEKNTKKVPVKKRIGTVIPEKLYVRKQPSKESGVVKIINKDQKVIITDDSDILFFKVRIDNYTGYCMKQYIKEGN